MPTAHDHPSHNGKVPSLNGKVPAWLAELGIKEGEYFCGSKLRAKRAMKSKCFSPAARVYLCLSLHTEGFQQELAVKMVAGGKREPLTPVDIAAESGLLKQNVRPALNELEACGLAEIKGSTKGRIEVYARALPQTPNPQKNGNARHYHFEGLSPQVLSFLHRFKIRLPENFQPSEAYFAAVEEAARHYKEAEMVLRAALKGNGAGECINKEERNEIEPERNGVPSSSSSGTTLPEPTTTITLPEPEPAKPAEALMKVLVEAFQSHPIGGMPSEAQVAEIVPLLPNRASPEVIQAYGQWLITEKLATRKLKSIGGLIPFTKEFARIYVQSPVKAAPRGPVCSKCGSHRSTIDGLCFSCSRVGLSP
jgi:hypothetical protein